MTAGVGLYQQSQMSSAAKILVIISDADRIVPAGAVAQRFVCVSQRVCVYTYVVVRICAFTSRFRSLPPVLSHSCLSRNKAGKIKQKKKARGKKC